MLSKWINVLSEEKKEKNKQIHNVENSILMIEDTSAHMMKIAHKICQ